mmetsp:Transcript_13771/g.41005  ORF Transcript_13771/g.41005 Transcript_13771/m.41005 type:complete len:135 (-) Transcript_13771:43-447(-)
MLRGHRKKGAWSRAEYVYFSLSNDPSLCMQFVDAHAYPEGHPQAGQPKGFLQKAMADPGSNAVYLYMLDPRHAQYMDLHQVFASGGRITQCMRFFSRCCRPVDVSPTTEGVTVLKVYWKEGDPKTPYVEELYSN